MDDQGSEKRMNAEMVVKNGEEDGPDYSLCEFFCSDGDIGSVVGSVVGSGSGRMKKKFQGACQINGRKFTPGGNVVLFLLLYCFFAFFWNFSFFFNQGTRSSYCEVLLVCV